MLKRILTLLTALIILLTLTTAEASAEGEFLVDVVAKYEVFDDGKTKVTNTITLENARSDLYATTYTLNLQSIEPKDVTASEDGGPLNIVEEREDNKVSLKVSFDKAVVGKGSKRTFKISYKEDGFALRTGEVWEISIPRLTDEATFRNYSVVLSIPATFGKESYLSPTPVKITQDAAHMLYFFDKASAAATGITAGFGKFQVFSFTLNYHLENPLNQEAVTTIALPPDTAFQKVHYTKISPKPNSIAVDEDGNWLAAYDLRPRQRLDIVAIGAVQIYANPRPFLTPDKSVLTQNTSQNLYWETDDPEIKELASRLKTARAIYDFVTENLEYNYERVRPNVERLGAKRALANPRSAICMEFTDVFIALARAAGIPTREINGFAYTENPEIQPLSLVADVLHAWPEYWSEEVSAWIPIDPTWASTTGGVDYFTKLDLRHFTFVIHGKNSSKPYPPGSYKLGPNPQKDVFVNFGQLPANLNSEPEIVVRSKRNFPLASTRLSITIKNPGPSALYNLNPKVYFDGKLVETGFSEVIPPFGDYEMQAVIPFSFIGAKTPDQVKVEVQDEEVIVAGFKNQVIIYNLIILSFVLLGVSLVILAKTGKLKFARRKNGDKKTQSDEATTRKD